MKKLLLLLSLLLATNAWTAIDRADLSIEQAANLLQLPLACAETE